MSNGVQVADAVEMPAQPDSWLRPHRAGANYWTRDRAALSGATGDIDGPLPGESAEQLVLRLARRSGPCLGTQRGNCRCWGPCTSVYWTVSCWSARDYQDARAMLLRMSGRNHTILSAVAVCTA
ncbi:MAG: hypothetical protein R3E89_06425 [Thiolinea sp.]